MPDEDDFIYNATDPSVMIDPSKWVTPGGLINPLNPLTHPAEVPKVESLADLKARHKNLDDAQTKAQKDYADAMDKSHAMIASGTNYSHDDLHDLAMKAADAQRLAAHLRAVRAQLPPIPTPGKPQSSPAYKARMAAQAAQSGSSTNTSAALDALAKARMAENPK